ncbi:uncharacterized protein J4E87_002544 [Alternaria ethzedia]|uniref:uncharacterized protein n=1 Tax=Alternaria ethzedia TaxID=181014 RepID=UPI0020C4B109|nr:uncharacterized protein J4E87_002544 [Alternaria ethzedia]KAI4631838.1 hypothetical protein J4E87_002544 [Alternaria ethzedia]
MEAIAGLSLAANILQVIDFTAKVLSTGNQLRQSGSTVQNSELERVVEDFTALNERITSWARPNPASSGPLAQDSQALDDLAAECTKIAQELIAKLESLRCSKDAARYKTILSALKATWNAKTIEDIKSRLQTMRDELQFRILVSIRDDQLQGLDETSRTAMLSIVESNKQLGTTITSQTEKIIQRQEVDSSLASIRHKEVLRTIANQRLEKYSIKDVPSAITSKLHFARKDDRYDDIDTAHQNTFNWALESRDSSSWPSLANWLGQDGGVYWINGKAGSGKSTLMKYLHQDPRFMDSLERWAGGDHLIVADYYFWSSGAQIQRSQEGLLRSLLWQVLGQDMSLASTLFAEQYLLNAEWDEFPTFHQLRRAFGRLTNNPLTSTKIVIVVDGLDEFDAQRITMTELGEMFITATKNGKIKALLSSRPLTEFTDCFAGQPQLQLQQLTHNDITKYVDDSLSVHPQMVYLKATYEDDTKALVEEIVSSASGVFLWVQLVVKSLLQGLQNGDKIEDLQLRLRALPQDLEALFTHMLSNVPPLYKSQAACIFQILRCNDEGHQQSSIMGRISARPLSAVRLSYAEAKTKEIMSAEICPLSDEELEKIEITTDRRLRSRCAGLLELRTRVKSQKEHTGRDESRQVKQISTKDVVYLHRTVADFLYKKEVWDDLVTQTEGQKFHASLAVLQSLIMEVKRINLAWQQPADRKVPWGLVIDTLLFARLAESNTQMSSRKLLDELDRAMTTYFPNNVGEWKEERYEGATWCDTWEEDYSRPAPWHDNFMSLNVRFGLTLYVQDTIRAKGQLCLDKRGRPLLDYACRPEPQYGHWSDFSDPDLVQTLLLNGADPNFKFNGFSAWQNCLFTPIENPVKWVSILKLLLLHGADANARIEKYKEGKKTALVVVQANFDKFLAGDIEATKRMKERFASRSATVPHFPVSEKTLAQLKLDVIELKELIANPRAVQGKVGDRSSKIFGERVTLFVKRNRVLHQVPAGAIIPSNLPSALPTPLFTFPSVTQFLIPTQQFCDRLLTFCINHNRVIGYPVCIREGKYSRNEFIFNFAIVIGENERDWACYGEVVRKLGRLLRGLEEQGGFLSREEEGVWEDEGGNVGFGQDDGVGGFGIGGGSKVYALCEMVLEDLNNYAECMIPIDDSNTINLKLFPTRPPPPPILAHQVPLLTISLSSLQQPVSSDLTLNRILPYINGINSIAHIAQLADTDLSLTRRAIQHLVYYGCLILLDIFSFSAIYAPTAEIGDFIMDAEVKEECMRYVSVPRMRLGSNAKTARMDSEVSERSRDERSSTSSLSSQQSETVGSTLRVSEFDNHIAAQKKEEEEENVWQTSHETLITLYTSLRQGLTLKNWVLENLDLLTGIDVRRFITFGIIKGFLYRVHKYAIATSTTLPPAPPTSLQTSTATSLANPRDSDTTTIRGNERVHHSSQPSIQTHGHHTSQGNIHTHHPSFSIHRPSVASAMPANHNHLQQQNPQHLSVSKGEEHQTLEGLVSDRDKSGSGLPLLRFLDGMHCFDEICTELGLPERVVEGKVRGMGEGAGVVVHR